MSDTPAGQPATLPAAVQAAAEVQARYFSGGAAPVPDAEDLHLARMMLEAAATHLAAAEKATLDEARAVARDLARICPMRVIPLNLMDRMRALPWLLDGGGSE